MAYVKNNIFVSGVSGTIGNKMNFRVTKSKTVVGVKRGPSTTPPTEEQQEVREKFIMATLYAQGAMKDPVIKALYQKAAKGSQSAYNAAFRDATNAPTIDDVNISDYKGAVGDLITVRARDVITPKSVTIVILSQAGVELEHGNAVLKETDRRTWVYTVTAANAAVTGTRVAVTVTDVPGNTTEKGITIS